MAVVAASALSEAYQLTPSSEDVGARRQSQLNIRLSGRLMMKNRETVPAGPRRRRMGLVAFASMAALAIVAPAQATTTATDYIQIDEAYAVGSTQTAYIVATYSCTASSGATHIAFLLGDPEDVFYPGFSTGYFSATCDGTAHTKTMAAGPGKPGDSASAAICLVNAQYTVVDGAREGWTGTLSNPPAAVAVRVGARQGSSIPGIPCS